MVFFRSRSHAPLAVECGAWSLLAAGFPFVNVLGELIDFIHRDLGVFPVHADECVKRLGESALSDDALERRKLSRFYVTE